MKKQLLGLVISCLAIVPLYAQKKKCVNRFDSTLARQHELSVSLGMSRAAPLFDRGGSGNGPSLAIEYARVYRFNHFLRAGLRVTGNSDNRGRAYELQAAPNDPDPSNGSMLPDNYSITKTHRRDFQDNTYAGIFIGYEYGVGRKSFRFTFGADLHVGYDHRVLRRVEDIYQETRTLDPLSGLYQYNIAFLQSGSVRGQSENIFVSLSPRLGIRRDLGRRVALALTFTPQIGFVQQVSYRESVTGSRPTDYYHPKSAWFAGANADIRVIFKLGKN